MQRKVAVYLAYVRGNLMLISHGNHKFNLKIINY